MTTNAGPSPATCSKGPDVRDHSRGHLRDHLPAPRPGAARLRRGQAHAFYLGYLGCAVDWEHRFTPDLPLYTQVSRGGLVLHLSEHHGDGTPGSVVYAELSGVRALHAELTAKDYPFQKPGLEEDARSACR